MSIDYTFYSLNVYINTQYHQIAVSCHCVRVSCENSNTNPLTYPRLGTSGLRRQRVFRDRLNPLDAYPNPEVISKLFRVMFMKLINRFVETCTECPEPHVVHTLFSPATTQSQFPNPEGQS